ncbi:MAG: DUF1287 domain-containing protein [Acidobacteriota bacterium]|nr:DUF1287 domain-containing protein [Acidobacteriota bacterium]
MRNTKLKLLAILLSISVLSVSFAACSKNSNPPLPRALDEVFSPRPIVTERPLAENAPRETRLIIESIRRQTEITKIYDQAYVVLDYPNGDVPAERGSCTDVVIRALRAAGVDLQKEVHEDIRQNFTVYPQKWGLKKPDKNIDHRRVPNLQTFFSRRGKTVPATNNLADFKPGDIVSWDLNGKGLTHIGVISNFWNEQTKRYLVIHNIGRGAQAEDVLFDWQITGHYRYF